METITHFLASIDWDFETLWKTGLTLLVGSLILSLFGRLIFGKRSALNHAVSSAVGIVCIVTITALLEGLGIQSPIPIAPMPFVSVSDGQLILFSFIGAGYREICSQVLSMMVLAFLVNLADRWLPTGKNLFSWVLFRVLTVLIAYFLHLISLGIIDRFVPEDIAAYAPVILLGLLVVLLLTGALKVPIGAVLSGVNPVIGGLYTFFFATVIGKQITKALLTTVILSAFMILLHYLGISAIALTGTAALLCLPFLLILIALWYLIFKVL